MRVCWPKAHSVSARPTWTVGGTASSSTGLFDRLMAARTDKALRPSLPLIGLVVAARLQNRQSKRRA